MSSQRGRDLLLKIGDGAMPEVFTTVAGLRATALNFSAGTIDATAADSANLWRELLGGGVKTLAVSGRGVFRDTAADAAVRQAFFSQAVRQWQIILPDFGTLSGPFLVTSLEYAGEYDGEQTFALGLASAGFVVFAEA